VAEAVQESSTLIRTYHNWHHIIHEDESIGVQGRAHDHVKSFLSVTGHVGGDASFLQQHAEQLSIAGDI